MKRQSIIKATRPKSYFGSELSGNLVSNSIFKKLQKPNAGSSNLAEQSVKLKAINAPDLNKIHNLSDIEVQNFKDERGYNLLMIAAEKGHSKAVEELLNRGEEINIEVNGESSISLAFAQKHHQVVIQLLRANSKFPHNFSEQHASNDVKTFIELSSKIHTFVQEGDVEEVKRILDENKTLKYFYDINNNSLLKTAILNRKFVIYELLISQNIFLAPHESMDDVLESLTKGQRKKFSEINFRLSPELVTEPMMILLRNCRFGPDNNKKLDHMDFVRKAFEFLFKIPSIAIILKIVAASQDFSIVFDFKRDSVTFLDPRSEPYTNGLFYISGRIYIAAKDMLDLKTSFNTISVIAHELCHYAMLLVYGNDAKPYRGNDDKARKRFNTICFECEENKGLENIISLVFDCYYDNMHHAELIVRVPQLIALHFNAIDVLNEKKEQFKDLFEFYEKVCVPQMEAELPKVKERFNPFKKQKVLKCWVIILILFLICGAIVGICGAFYLYNPTLKWSELSAEDKIKIKDSKINFYGVDVKFGELFTENSTAYDLLSSEQMKSALKNDTSGLLTAIEVTLDVFIYLHWSNMTDNMKRKILDSAVNFQGQNISISNLTTSNSTMYYLSCKQIIEVFEGHTLPISSSVETKAKFQFERFFIKESTEIQTNHYSGDKVNLWNSDIKNIEDIFRMANNSRIFLLSSIAGEGKSTTFKHFTIKLKEKHPTYWVQFVDLKKHLNAYEVGKTMNIEDKEILKFFLFECLLKLTPFESEIFKELFDNSKIIFLWDGIDEVSPLYKEFMLRLTRIYKQINLNVQYISTRPQHSVEFSGNLTTSSYKLVPLGKVDAIEFLTKLIFIQKVGKYENEFWNEFRSYYYSFSSDENIAMIISNNLQNLQYSLILDNVVIIRKGVRIIDIILDSKRDSITKLRERRDFVFKSCPIGYKANMRGLCKKVFRIGSSRTYTPQDFTVKKILVNPLIIEMIAEVCKNTSKTIDIKLYYLYEQFVEKKLNITIKEKGVAINNEFILASAKATRYEMHQYYALDLICKEIGQSKCSLISQTPISLKKIDGEKVSRMGILQIFSKDDYNFVHKTFAEFFFAQYLIDDFIMGTKEVEFKLKLIMEALFTDSLLVVRNFLLSYNADDYVSPFSLFLAENNQKLERIQKITENAEVLKKFYIFSFSNFCQSVYKLSCEKMAGFNPLTNDKISNEYLQVLSDKKTSLIEIIGDTIFNQMKNG